MTSDPSAIPAPDDGVPHLADAGDDATFDAAERNVAAASQQVAKTDEQPAKPEPMYGKSVLFAPLLMFAPRLAGRKTARANLLLVMILHFAATVAFFAYGLVMVAWYDAVSDGEPMAVLERFSEMMRDLPPRWEEKLLVLASFLLGFMAVEGGHLLLVFLLWPWVARDEPVSDSFVAALRRVALWTVAVLGPAVFLLTPAFTANARYWYEYRHVWNYGKNVTADWNQWQDSLPFLVRHNEMFMAFTWLGLILWSIWALLRFAGSDRPTRPLPHDTVCEHCGYNLMHMTMEQSCPECGTGVNQTLGQHVRPGVAWQRDGKFPNVIDWFRTMWAAIMRPVETGKTIRTRAYTYHHRNFFCITLFGLAVISFLGMLGVFFVSQWRYGMMAPDVEEFVLIPFMSGYVTVLLALLVTLASALLCGVVQSLWNKRNLMYPAMQGACYLGGVLMLWTALFWMTFVIALIPGIESIFEAVANLFRVRDDIIYMWFYFLFFGGFLCLFVFLNSRIAKHTRYANK